MRVTSPVAIIVVFTFVLDSPEGINSCVFNDCFMINIPSTRYAYLIKKIQRLNNESADIDAALTARSRFLR